MQKWVETAQHTKVANQPKTVFLRITVDETLRNDFKAACAKEGKTMNDTVAQLLEEFVQRTAKAKT